MAGGDLQIRVLGTPAVADEQILLAPREADLLTALALCPEGRSAKWLLQNLWPKIDHDHPRTVATHIAYLRQKGVAFLPTPKGGLYRLDHDPDAVDCRRFVRGVHELPERPEPAAVDELLALWSGDPWARGSEVPRSLWAEVREDLRRLLAVVTALGEGVRTLRHWGAFERMLAGGELLEAVRGPAVVPRRKPQVLIVDDQIGHEMADVLGNYDTEVIESLPAWNQRKDDGRPLRHVCALVDLHLKKEMTDRGGLTVVRDLQDLTDMKIVVLSAELPPFEDCGELCASLGVDKVLPKHNRPGGDFARVGDVVRELVAS